MSTRQIGLVAQDVEVVGDITFEGRLRVEGRVSGKIASHDGTLEIASSGEVDANVDVGNCIIDGSVQGDVNARRRIEIRKSGHVKGNVHAPALSMDTGAVIEGMIHMANGSGGAARSSATGLPNNPKAA